MLRYLLPPWLRRLQSLRPDIEVELFESKVPAVALVRSGEADLLVDHLPQVPPDLEARQVGRARAFLVFPSHHPLARKGTVSPRQLGDEPFITYSADLQLRDLQLSALAHHGVKPRRLHAADSSETILGFVAAGLGYSLLASLLPKGPRVPGVIAQPVTQPAREFPIYAAWRKSAHADPLLAALLSLAPQP
jgi:DNA-binding transcriptional LysR family regulator